MKNQVLRMRKKKKKTYAPYANLLVNIFTVYGQYFYIKQSLQNYSWSILKKF